MLTIQECLEGKSAVVAPKLVFLVVRVAREYPVAVMVRAVLLNLAVDIDLANVVVSVMVRYVKLFEAGVLVVVEDDLTLEPYLRPGCVREEISESDGTSGLVIFDAVGNMKQGLSVLNECNPELRQKN